MKVAWRLVAAAGVVFVARSFPALSATAALAALLLCAALGLVAMRSTSSGPVLIATLAGLGFISTAFINVTEAVLFGIVDVTAAPIMLLRELGVAILAATAVAAAVGRLRASPPSSLHGPTLPDSTLSVLWRLAAAVAVFVVCYFAVGAMIYPWVKPYYEGRAIPPVGSIVSMQVLRAIALVAAMYPAIRAMPSRRTAQWVFAVVLPVLGGLVPLIPDNPLMPLPVRAVHAVEIVTYYTLYGALVATWFGASGRVGSSRVAMAAPVPR